MRQAAIFGIGTIAQLAPQDFQPFVPDALTLLVANINAPDAKEEDIQPVTDNAVSALSKLCLTFHTAIGEHLEQLIMLVVSHMPVTVDLDEAVIVHEHLCQYLSSYVRTTRCGCDGWATLTLQLHMTDTRRSSSARTMSTCRAFSPSSPP